MTAREKDASISAPVGPSVVNFANKVRVQRETRANQKLLIEVTSEEDGILSVIQHSCEGTFMYDDGCVSSLATNNF